RTTELLSPSAVPLNKAPEQETYPASSAQRSIYLTQRLDPDSTGYNMPFALELEGELDVRRLEQAFLALIERHESLRTSFAVEDGELRQRVHSLAELQWKLDVQSLDKKEEADEEK